MALDNKGDNMTVKFVVKYEWKGGENRLYYTIEAHLPNPIPSLLHNNKNIILGKFNIENENSGVEIDGERVFTLKQSEFYCSTNEPEEIFTKTYYFKSENYNHANCY